MFDQSIEQTVVILAYRMINAPSIRLRSSGLTTNLLVKNIIEKEVYLPEQYHCRWSGKDWFNQELEQKGEQVVLINLNLAQNKERILQEIVFLFQSKGLTPYLEDSDQFILKPVPPPSVFEKQVVVKPILIYDLQLEIANCTVQEINDLLKEEFNTNKSYLRHNNTPSMITIRVKDSACIPESIDKVISILSRSGIVVNVFK
jgi:hypothetical protein